VSTEITFFKVKQHKEQRLKCLCNIEDH